MIEEERLKILTEGAKYDVSCSSSGSRRKNEPGGLGNAAFGGICHSFAADGRCISLLKILMSNDCVFDCRYCPNRRNAAELLRRKYRFNGYIHLKGIPKADPLLVEKAALLADRMSYNLELPGEESLKKLAPQKTKKSLLLPMGQLAQGKKAFASGRRLIGAQQNEKPRLLMVSGLQNAQSETAATVFRAAKRPLYLPAGQTTQMIVGASPERDGKILRLSGALYRKFSLRRVYFSAYLPVVNDPSLPSVGEKLLREHRLYQADWLMRYYGFAPEEIADEDENLPVEYDPKCAWALRHPENFPVEVNRADLASLLRVPGIGVRSANKIIAARRHTKLTYEDLKKMRVVLKRARHFITTCGKFYGEEKEERVKALLAAADVSEGAAQLSMFSADALINAPPAALLSGGKAAAMPGFTGARTDLPPDETQKKLQLSTPEIRRSVLTGEL